MKNLAVFLIVFVLFFVAPAMAQRATAPSSGGNRFEDFFGPQTGVVGVGSVSGNATTTTVGSAVSEQDADDFRELAREEVRQTFSDKSFTVIETEEESTTFTVEVKIFSRERAGSYGDRYYQYSYHREPETIVFVTVRHRASGAVVVVGEGKNKNLHRAVEKAAGSAADKLKKKKADRTIFLP